MTRRTIGLGAETIGFVVCLNIRALFSFGFVTTVNYSLNNLLPVV
jgi:hypothetical protein